MSERPRVMITEHGEGRAEPLRRLMEANGADADIKRLYLGEPLGSTNDYDAVISGGGPMGIYEMHMPEYDFLNKEAEFIAEMIAKNKAVLGVCLGHQLLAHVLGSEVVLSPANAEVGWSKISLTQDGKNDPLFENVPDDFFSFQYHNDRVVAIPEGSRLLANTTICDVQSFHYANQPVWGVQFHPEISAERAEEILLSRRQVLEEQGLDVVLAIRTGHDANHQPRKQIFYNFTNLIK